MGTEEPDSAMGAVGNPSFWSCAHLSAWRETHKGQGWWPCCPSVPRLGFTPKQFSPCVPHSLWTLLDLQAPFRLRAPAK